MSPRIGTREYLPDSTSPRFMTPREVNVGHRRIRCPSRAKPSGFKLGQSRDRKMSDSQRISNFLTIKDGQLCDTEKKQNPRIPHEYAQRRKIGRERPDGAGGDSKPQEKSESGQWGGFLSDQKPGSLWNKGKIGARCRVRIGNDFTVNFCSAPSATVIWSRKALPSAAGTPCRLRRI